MQSLPALLDARLRAVTGVDPEMRPATKPQFGHFQSNVALRLAKEQKRPPREVAADIVAQLDVSDLCEPLEIAGPGFINFRIRADVLAQAATAVLEDPHHGLSHTSHRSGSSSTTRRPTLPSRCTSGTCAPPSSATVSTASSPSWGTR